MWRAAVRMADNQHAKTLQATYRPTWLRMAAESLSLVASSAAAPTRPHFQMMVRAEPRLLARRVAISLGEDGCRRNACRRPSVSRARELVAVVYRM